MAQNHTLNVLYLAHGLFMLASIMLTSLYAIFAEPIVHSIILIGYLGSTLFIAKMVGTLVMRFFGDKLRSQKYTLIFGYILKSCGWFLLIYTQSIVGLFCIQALLGFSEGVQSPAFRALMARNLDQGKEVSEYANWELILAVTGIAGTAIAGIIVGSFGFPVLFIILAALAACAASICALTKTIY